MSLILIFSEVTPIREENETKKRKSPNKAAQTCDPESRHV